MRTPVDRVLEVFDEESSPDVMSALEAIEFIEELMFELDTRRAALVDCLD
jgi:hypothetical protein